MKTTLTKRCAKCKKKFFKKYNYSKRYFSKQKFCSFKCRDKSYCGRHVSPKTEFKKGHPHGLRFTSKSVLGPKNCNWNGGRSKRGGYVFILNRAHPFADKLGYVREHRLVMEKKLGRFLSPGEVVHHINEVKDDNRIENLQLFSDEK